MLSKKIINQSFMYIEFLANAWKNDSFLPFEIQMLLLSGNSIRRTLQVKLFFNFYIAKAIEVIII